MPHRSPKAIVDQDFEMNVTLRVRVVRKVRKGRRGEGQRQVRYEDGKARNEATLTVRVGSESEGVRWNRLTR